MEIFLFAIFGYGAGETNSQFGVPTTKYLVHKLTPPAPALADNLRRLGCLLSLNHYTGPLH